MLPLLLYPSKHIVKDRKIKNFIKKNFTQFYLESIKNHGNYCIKSQANHR